MKELKRLVYQTGRLVEELKRLVYQTERLVEELKKWFIRQGDWRRSCKGLFTGRETGGGREEVSLSDRETGGGVEEVRTGRLVEESKRKYFGGNNFLLVYP